MPEPIMTNLAIEAGKGTLGVLNENQKGIINYFLVNFFGNTYKDYLKNNILINKTAEFEANREFERNIQNVDHDIHPILLAVQNESEIEYKNMFGVLEKTILKIKENANGNIDSDKMKRLKDLSKDFSSDEMQEVIAGILAGEYNQAGSFSLKTMDIVRSLSRDDLNLFRRFCGLVVDKEFIFGNFFELLNKNKLRLNQLSLNYEDYLYLQELGLFTGSKSITTIGDNSNITYYNITIANKLVKLYLGKEINLSGKSFLTKAGKELYNLVEPIFNQEVFDMIYEELISQGFEYRL